MIPLNWRNIDEIPTTMIHSGNDNGRFSNDLKSKGRSLLFRAHCCGVSMAGKLKEDKRAQLKLGTKFYTLKNKKFNLKYLIL